MSASKLLTTSEVADRFRVSNATVINWIKKGLLPGSFRLPSKKTYRIPSEAISALAFSSPSKTPVDVEEII